MKYLNFTDSDAYNVAFDLSNKIWDIVIRWPVFAQRTVGEQFVKATDSISANLAEGFGRHFKRDKVKFYQYSRGSTAECYNWLRKSHYRKLITTEQYEQFRHELERLPLLINTLIKFTRTTLKQ